MALSEYQNAFTSSKDPETQSAALLGTAQSQISSGEYQAGAENLLVLIQQYPQSTVIPIAHFYLGQAYDALGRYREAADEYLNYLALRSGVVDAYVLKLRGELFMGSWGLRWSYNRLPGRNPVPQLLRYTCYRN